MKQQLVFVDDSGDTGLKKSNTTRFIVAAVLLANQENLIKLTAAINGFRAGLRWDELHEFKFSAVKKSIIKDLIGHIRKFDFESYVVVLDKTKVKNLPPSENLYNFTLKELLVRLNLSNPVIVIDGVYDKKQAQRTRTYLRQALKSNGTAKCKINFVDSRKDSIVQLADIVAGSVARSYDKSKADRNDCLKLLKPKIKEIYEISP